MPAVAAVGLPAQGAAAAGPPALPRNDSGETIQQPNPFEAMLHHLRGPQYASPARFALRGRAALQLEQAGSPQSPKELTPLHLISVTEGSTSPAAREQLAGWQAWGKPQSKGSAHCNLLAVG